MPVGSGISISGIDYEWVECWQCGGEGYIANCWEEYACIDPEGGCDECLERCDICGGEGGWRRSFDAQGQRTDSAP